MTTTPPDILARLAEARERIPSLIHNRSWGWVDSDGVRRLLADAEAELTRLRTPMQCGHPVGCFTASDLERRDEGATCWCRMCELEAEIDRLGVELTRANMQASEWREEFLVERRLRERAEQDWRETAARLRRLVDAADAYAADQSRATDPRCGLVQPVTVAEAEELNQALREARSRT